MWGVGKKLTWSIRGKKHRPLRGKYEQRERDKNGHSGVTDVTEKKNKTIAVNFFIKSGKGVWLPNPFSMFVKKTDIL